MDFQISGNPDIRKSGNPDIWICGYLEIHSEFIGTGPSEFGLAFQKNCVRASMSFQVLEIFFLNAKYTNFSKLSMPELLFWKSFHNL
jgi:hypothetical protein